MTHEDSVNRKISTMLNEIGKTNHNKIHKWTCNIWNISTKLKDTTYLAQDLVKLYKIYYTPRLLNTAKLVKQPYLIESCWRPLTKRCLPSNGRPSANLHAKIKNQVKFGFQPQNLILFKNVGKL